MWGNKKGASKRIDSLVGNSTQITGDLDFIGGLLIDGKVIGNITATDDENATITISENGYVKGEIKIPNIIINGTIEGNVYASNNVELAKKARVFGNVYYNLFEMAMGAEVNGNLVHVTEENFLGENISGDYVLNDVLNDKTTPSLEVKSAQPRLDDPDIFTKN